MNKQREALELALQAINSLWNIIDDIDTASDIAKFDDRLYRNQVEALQARRWKLDISTDGQVLTGKVIAAIREALAEPEQEPMSWYMAAYYDDQIYVATETPDKGEK